MIHRDRDRDCETKLAINKIRQHKNTKQNKKFPCDFMMEKLKGYKY